MFLYLHGFASGPTSSKALYLRDRLAEHGKNLLIPELDSGDFEHLTITSQLKVIEETAVGEDVTLIGSSMGGYLAALYAAAHQNVKRLLLLAPAFGFTERWPSSLGDLQAEQWKRSGFLPVYHHGLQRQAQLHYGLLEDAAQYPPFPAFSQPALILHGQQDTVVPLEFSERYAAAHSNARLEVLPGGHEMTAVLTDIWHHAESFLLA